MGMFDSLYEGNRETSLATVVDGVLVDIDNERAHRLPLFNYSGHRVNAEPAAQYHADPDQASGVGSDG